MGNNCCKQRHEEDVHFSLETNQTYKVRGGANAGNAENHIGNAESKLSPRNNGEAYRVRGYDQSAFNDGLTKTASGEEMKDREAHHTVEGETPRVEEVVTVVEAKALHPSTIGGAPSSYDKDKEIKRQENLLEQRKEIVKQRLRYIEDFYTQTLRNAELKAGLFNKSAFSDYKISKESLLYAEDANLIEDLLTVENEDSIYYGSRNNEGQRHGFGIQLQRGGIKREGFWFRDHFEPYGRFINKEGIVYEGNYSRDKLNGIGKELKPHSSYFGEFVNGFKHGFGKYENANEIYEGYYKNNLKEGRGDLVFKNTGNAYSGDFLKGKMHGKCVYNWKSGEQYIGDMFNGALHGYGEYSWPSGEKYVGQYVEGIRQGKGKFTWPDGRIFEGEFINNVPQMTSSS